MLVPYCMYSLSTASLSSCNKEYRDQIFRRRRSSPQTARRGSVRLWYQVFCTVPKYTCERLLPVFRAAAYQSLFRSYCGSYPTLHIRCLRLKAHLKCFRLCNRRHRSSKDRGCTDCAPLSFPCRLCAVPNRDAHDKDHCQERPFQAQTRDRI